MGLLDERVLVGWLCIMRHNLNRDGQGSFAIPPDVRLALMAAGWVTCEMEPGGGAGTIHVTPKGCAVSDLAAPEWGIDPIGVAD